MKKFSKKSVLLFAAAMALCAFTMPSMASASSWGPVGSEHTLDTSNIGFINDVSGIVSNCTASRFTVDVTSTAVIEITSSAFTGCTATGGAAGQCTVTSTGTNFPWTATARTTSDIQIHGVNIDVNFETTPGGGPACNIAGASLRITGTLSSGRWTGNAAGQRGIELNGATGLVAHSALLPANSPITPIGTVTDNTQNTLTVTN